MAHPTTKTRSAARGGTAPAGWARLLPVALLALQGACAGGSTGVDGDEDPPPVTSFDFLEGSWSVTSRYREGGGAFVETTGQATVGTDIAGRAIKEQWVGTRGGDPAEMRALVVPSDRPGRWVVARGDGAAGTFDVLEGLFVDSRIVLLSRPGTRPDGGMTRETYEEITDTAFTWRAERSDDGGSTWTEYWVLRYAATGAPGPLTGPADAVGCQADEYRQFDFWEGAWSVGASTNDLRSLLGRCILEESWSSPSETGTSFNMYDPRSGLWTQVWTDTNRNTVVIFGGIDGDRMILAGPRQNVLDRITWTPIGPDVRQLGEVSGDGGATWTTAYDLRYTPR